MKKIIAIGGSNSRQSINKNFASWAANEVSESQVETLDLNDFEMPIYSVDRESESGIPQQAHDFKSKLKGSDGIVLSLAEHNGSYSTAFKNITDWVSRIERSTWADKPMFLLATSPGQRGGLGVLNTAQTTMPYQGALVSGTYSLPSFGSHFDTNQGITDENMRKDFLNQLEVFVNAINKSQIEAPEANAAQ